jgi:hypothetical protein
VVAECAGHESGSRSEPGSKKKIVKKRDLTTALLYLRASEIGLSQSDLESMEIGEIFDMYEEKSKDIDEEENGGEYEPTQEFYDNF